ncbi:MAG: copper-binding protein [Burkholderiaceae bacterium]
MNPLSTLVLAALLAAPALPALAQHAGHAMPMAADAKGKGEGEIRRIDADNQRVAIKHGPITGTLEMGPMSMVFAVKDTKMLTKLKAGDKVKFEVEQQGEVLVLTKLEAVK